MDTKQERVYMHALSRCLCFSLQSLSLTHIIAHSLQSSYFYAADPYDGARARAKEDKKKAPKNVSENPFRPSSFTIKGLCLVYIYL